MWNFYNQVLEFTLLFILLFVVKIPYLYSTIFVTLIILFFLYLIRYNKVRNNVRKIFGSRIFFKLLSCILLIVIITFLVTVFHGSYDYTMLSTLFNQLINYIVVALFLGVFYDKDKDINYYIDVVVKCFALQGLIMVLSLLFPSFKSIVELTQSVETIEKSLSSYGGYRNLAFGATQFFGLNAAFGIALLLNSYLIVSLKRKVYWLTFFLICIGIFFSGRTSIIAVFCCLFFITWELRLSKVEKFKYFIGSLFVIILIGVFSSKIYNVIPIGVREWFFEFYYNYQKTGSLATRSSSHLVEKMYFIPESQIILLGSGKYTNIDGSYFMHTDAGYMRILLYYGFLGIVMYLMYYLIIVKELFSFFKLYYKSIMFFVILTFLELFYTFKGEFISFSIMGQNLLFLLVFIGCLNKRSYE